MPPLRLKKCKRAIEPISKAANTELKNRKMAIELNSKVATAELKIRKMANGPNSKIATAELKNLKMANEPITLYTVQWPLSPLFTEWPPTKPIFTKRRISPVYSQRWSLFPVFTKWLLGPYSRTLGQYQGQPLNLFGSKVKFIKPVFQRWMRG